MLIDMPPKQDQQKMLAFAAIFCNSGSFTRTSSLVQRSAALNRGNFFSTVAFSGAS